MELTELSGLEEDALREVMSMGMGHASISLSQMIGEKIDVNLTALDLVPLNKISKSLGDKNVLSTGVYLRITGDLLGTTLLVFSRKSALLLADLLSGRPVGNTKVLNLNDRSGLEELGSILTASFLNAMGDFLKVKLYPSTPVTVFDVSSSIVNFVLIGVKKDVDFGLLVRVRFAGEKNVIAGNFLLLLDAGSLGNLIELLDKRIEEQKRRSGV